MKISISNEMEAVQFLEQYLENSDIIDNSNIEVSGWDNFNIHLVGEKFHNSITPSVMAGLIELQKALYEAYALAVYNDKNINRLTQEEKQQLEIQVKVSEGSANLDIDINAIFIEFVNATAGKMNSEQVVMLFVFVILVYFGRSAWKDWLDKQQAIKEKELENELQEKLVEQLSENNRRVVSTLEKVALQSDKASQIFERSKDTKAKIVRSAKYADEVDIGNITSMSGEQAVFYTSNGRTDWEPRRLDGKYRLLKVDSSSTLERKVKIRNLVTGQELLATLKDETLEKAHLSKLGTAEWGHHPAILRVEVKMKQGKAKDAVILSVDSVDTNEVFDDEANDDN